MTTTQNMSVIDSRRQYVARTTVIDASQATALSRHRIRAGRVSMIGGGRAAARMTVRSPAPPCAISDEQRAVQASIRFLAVAAQREVERARKQLGLADGDDVPIEHLPDEARERERAQISTCIHTYIHTYIEPRWRNRLRKREPQSL